MARRHAPAERSGGGARIPSLRPARARLINGLAAVAAVAAVSGWTAVGGRQLSTVGGVLAAMGVVLLAAGIVLRWPASVPWAVLAVGAGYVLGREGAGVVEGWAAVIGVLLLLAAELALGSIEHDDRIPAEAGLLRHRAATLVALLLGALLVNFLLLASAAVSTSSGVLLAAVGVAAAVSAVAVVLRLVRA